VDAFKPAEELVHPDVIGIDLGITLLMAENARTGFVWGQFMKNEAVKKRDGPRGVSLAIVSF